MYLSEKYELFKKNPLSQNAHRLNKSPESIEIKWINENENFVTFTNDPKSTLFQKET
jgi:hypothetical protein